MKTLLAWFVAIVLCAAVGRLVSTEQQTPNLRTVLFFDDGTVQVCPTYDFSNDGTTATSYVSVCRPDTIFEDGFE